MSMVFNVVGGGSKGASNTDAVLHVTVPTGSEVIMARTGMSLTPTIWTSNFDNTKDIAIFFIGSAFFSNSDAWTVTATLNSNSVSKTIIISENKKYDMFLAYDLALMANGAFFDNSDFLTSAKKYLSTGADYKYGPETAKVTSSTPPVYRVGSTSGAGSGTSAATRSGIAYYQTPIDVTPYNYITLKYSGYNSTNQAAYCSLNLYSSLDTTYGEQCIALYYNLIAASTSSETSMATLNIDISAVTGPIYVSFFTFRGASYYSYINLNEITFKTNLS